MVLWVITQKPKANLGRLTTDRPHYLPKVRRDEVQPGLLVNLRREEGMLKEVMMTKERQLVHLVT